MLESTYEYNDLLLNDQTERALARGKYYKVKSITGLDDADIRETRIDRPGTHGEIVGDSFYGGRSLVLTGELRARTLFDLRDMQSSMQHAFGDLSYHNFVFTPWNGEKRFIRVKKNQKLDIPEEQTGNTFMRPFTVGLRAEDPFFYGYIENTVSFTQIGVRKRIRTYTQDIVENTHAKKARIFPRTYPTLTGINPTVTSAGNYISYPISRLHGGMTNPVFTNLTTGQRIIFTDLVIQPNSYVELNHKTGVIKWFGYEDNYSGFDIVNSEFWGLVSGLNDLQVSALSSDSSAYWEVIWRNVYL